MEAVNYQKALPKEGLGMAVGSLRLAEALVHVVQQRANLPFSNEL